MGRNKKWYDVAIIDSGIGEYCRQYQECYAGQINFIFDEYGAGKIFEAAYFTGMHAIRDDAVIYEIKSTNRAATAFVNIWQ